MTYRLSTRDGSVLDGAKPVLHRVTHDNGWREEYGMTADQTVRVEPGSVRRVGTRITNIGDGLGRDYDRVTGSLIEEPDTRWAVLSASDTLQRLWRGHLAGVGAMVSDHGERLTKIADAYQKADVDAARSLGVALPTDVRVRPGIPVR